MAADAAPERLLQMQNLKSCTRSPESESALEQHPQMILIHFKVWEALVREDLVNASEWLSL